MKAAAIGLLCALLAVQGGCSLPHATPAEAAATPAAPSSPAAPSPGASAPPAAAGTPSASPGPEHTPARSAAPIVEKTGDENCRVQCDDYLTLRGAPALTAGALRRLSDGETVKVRGYEGAFALVTDGGGRTGYVLSGYLAPAEEDPYLAGLDAVKPAECYSYGRMMNDLDRLASLYPEKLRMESAGKSLEGRDIPVAVVGDPGAKLQILVQAGIHGREHMTSLLAMAQLEYCLKYEQAPFAGSTAGLWLGGVCLRVLPMANPDGVTISQARVMTGALAEIYRQDMGRENRNIAPNDYLALWKANAAGVDINRNFPTGWQALASAEGPSFWRYKGGAPADQPETRALMEYSQKHAFAATVSYHATGSCLYWQYGSNGAVNGLSRDLALAVRDVTKYTLTDTDETDGGGYKDWAMDALGIPSVTIEVGTRDCPLPPVEFHTVWERNRNVLAAVCKWVKTATR